MADLTQFVSKDLHSGSKIDLYLGDFGHIKIGDGSIEVLEPLHLKTYGKGEVLGYKFDASLEIVMPDTALKGQCKVRVGNGDFVLTEYWVEGGKLHITMFDVTVHPENHWTWVHVNIPKVGAHWLGIWPQGVRMTEEDKTQREKPEPSLP